MTATLARQNDIVGDHTIAELRARGFTAEASIEVRAFAIYLRRRSQGVQRDEHDLAYETGERCGGAYLEDVAPHELEGVVT